MRIAASITPNNTKFGPLLFPGNLAGACRFLSETGYDGVEISLRDPSDPYELSSIEKALRHTNLDVVSIATGQSYIEDGFFLFSGDDVLRRRCIERLKGHIDLARHYDAAVIVGGIRGKITRMEFLSDYLTHGERAFDEVCEHAGKQDVTILLEPVNRYETNIINTVADAQSLIDRGGYTDVVRILPDTFHMNIEEVDIKQTLEVHQTYIGALHCADSNRYAPGMGHTDFKSIISTINLESLLYLGVEVLPWPDSEKAAETAYATVKDAVEASCVEK